MLYFKPQIGSVGDVIPFYYGQYYHLFYLIAQTDPKRRLQTPWGHIRSRDLVNWQVLPTAIAPSGENDSPDKCACWTGSVVEQNGTFHLFYTGVNLDKPSGQQRICHATSKDLVTWVKDANNPIIEPDTRWYELDDWRDPFVYWDEETGLFRMFITARSNRGWLQRRGCIALATSRDLQSWHIHPPLWEPHIAHTLECSERFEVGGQTYLAFSTYSENFVTHYRLVNDAHQILSPPDIDAIDGRFFYAAKGLNDGTQQLTFGWIPEISGKRDDGEIMWGGYLGIPHTLSPGDDGILNVYYPDAYRNIIGPPMQFRQSLKVGNVQQMSNDFTLSSCSGAAYVVLTPQTQAFYMSCHVNVTPGTHSAGLFLNADKTLNFGYFIEFRIASSSLQVSKYYHGRKRILVERVIPHRSHNYYMELFYEKGLLTVFVNKSVALSAILYDANNSFGFIVQSGHAKIYDVNICSLKSVNKSA